MMKEHELMGFGKYHDTKLGDVPASYLLWFFEQKDAKTNRPELFEYIEKNIRHLQKDAKNEKWNAYDER